MSMTFRFDESKPLISYHHAYQYTMQEVERSGITPPPDGSALFIKASLVKLEADWYRYIETEEKTTDIDIPGADMLRLVRFVGYELKRVADSVGLSETPIERLDHYPNGLPRMYFMEILEEDIKLMYKIYRVLKPLPAS